MDEMKALDFSAAVRPHRTAFLVSTDVPRDWVCDQLIPLMSCVWGGACSFVMPVARDLDADANFNSWIALLARYDPDQVVSTGNFPLEFLRQVQHSCMCSEDVFQFSSGAVKLPSVRHGRADRIPVEVVLKATLDDPHVIDYTPSGDGLLDLWWWAHAGRIGAYTDEAVRRGVRVEPDRIDPAALLRNLGLVDEPKAEWPRPRSMTGLGHTWADLAAPVVIVGDDFSDWALFQCLRLNRANVHWLPKRVLIPPGEYVGGAALMKYLVYDNAGLSQGIVTSTSLGAEELDAAIIGSMEHLGGRARLDVSYRIASRFESVCDRFLRWGEANNRQDSTIVFQGKVALQRAPVLAPKFPIGPEHARFLVEADCPRYSYLAHPRLSQAPIVSQPLWEMRGYARRTRDGGVAFNPVSPAYFSGASLPTLLQSPRLTLPSVLEDFGRLLPTGYTMQESDKAPALRRTLALWRDSLPEFCRDVVASEMRCLFDSYIAGGNARASLLSAEYGVEVRKELFFAFPTQSAFRSPPQKWNEKHIIDWIDRGIILRGILLTCAACGHKDFYSPLTGDRFQCKRCDDIDRITSGVLGLREPRFVYRLNPVVTAFLRERGEVVLWTVHQLMSAKSARPIQWAAEIAVRKDGNSYHDIDIILNLGGEPALAECKSSGDFTGQQADRYVKLCRESNIRRFVCGSTGHWHKDSQEAIQKRFLGVADVTFIGGPDASGSG